MTMGMKTTKAKNVAGGHGSESHDDAKRREAAGQQGKSDRKSAEGPRGKTGQQLGVEAVRPAEKNRFSASQFAGETRKS